MKKTSIVILFLILIVSCTKEQTTPSIQKPEISTSDLDALKKEISELRDIVNSLTLGVDSSYVSVSDFEALKRENDSLKVIVEKLTSDFFEVDGLRFDKNGDIISLPKLEKEVIEKQGNNVTFTKTRNYDAEGRIIETMNKYFGYSSSFPIYPYYWQKTMYQYVGKTCIVTTQTSEYGLPAGVSYAETVKKTVYW